MTDPPHEKKNHREGAGTFLSLEKQQDQRRKQRKEKKTKRTSSSVVCCMNHAPRGPLSACPRCRRLSPPSFGLGLSGRTPTRCRAVWTKSKSWLVLVALARRSMPANPHQPGLDLHLECPSIARHFPSISRPFLRPHPVPALETPRQPQTKNDLGCRQGKREGDEADRVSCVIKNSLCCAVQDSSRKELSRSNAKKRRDTVLCCP